MSVIEKAHELANAITNSTEYQELRKAEEAMLNDAAAQDILDRYREIQENLDTQAPSDDLQESIENIEREMKNTPVIVNYLDAQEKVMRLLEEVNFILGRAINGDNEACDSGNCGGGCCGCS